MTRALNFTHTGLLFGHARPERSDEWAVITPLAQAAANIGFGRFKTSSPYHDDFRIAFGSPIKAWGLIFKPTMLLYPFVNAAYAFFVHYFAVFAPFIVGYMAMFRVMQVAKLLALLLSLSIYFTSYAQF
ncbi:hypothetical protein P9250_29315 [Caballeronia sp. LP006]|uniref:DUF7657 domain-containing protein n=1 Tax=Caballeronia sp. LP006 TaxID=3038552 RepID=UPI002865B545|nr:hypothetical protein [Caballeronia sp. LP006]MDR5831966.1 hypothetical protein [Caballeronia sp. LP006]